MKKMFLKTVDGVIYQITENLVDFTFYAPKSENVRFIGTRVDLARLGNGQIFIEFVNGGRYLYTGVDNAIRDYDPKGSAGKWVSQNLRVGTHKTEKVEDYSIFIARYTTVCDWVNALSLNMPEAYTPPMGPE